jgi:hypothetical protein
MPLPGRAPFEFLHDDLLCPLWQSRGSLDLLSDNDACVEDYSLAGGFHGLRWLRIFSTSCQNGPDRKLVMTRGFLQQALI